MNTIFRPADMGDYAQILSLFQSAVRCMQSEGIDQWDDVYPDEATLLSDIRNGWMHLLVKNNAVACAVALNELQDEEYIHGDWLCRGGKIAVVHRLCVQPAFQNGGVGRDAMRRSQELLGRRGYSSVRLDTFSGNPKAIRLYESLGYRRAGKVFFRKGEFYLFEKPLVTK